MSPTPIGPRPRNIQPLLAERLALAGAVAPLVVIFGAVLVWAMVKAHGAGGFVFATAMWFFAFLSGMAQTLRARVVVGPDGVTVRNTWRTHVLAWHDVERFTACACRRRAPWGRTTRYHICAELRSGGRVALEVIHVPDLDDQPGRRRPWQQAMDDLNADLAAARAPLTDDARKAAAIAAHDALAAAIR